MLYDKYDEVSIIHHAKKIENKSLNLYIMESESEYMRDSEVITSLTSYNAGKGSLGQLVEEVVFGYSINSKQAADFEEVNMELKVVPLKAVKKSDKNRAKVHGLSVKERIVLSIIDYHKLNLEEWESNTLNSKLIKLLLMFYLHEKDKEKMDLVFKLVNKWEPSDAELEVIKNDWLIIRNKVRDGLAHELSEGDTFYLGACTKGASSKSVRSQPNSNLPAKQRAFSLKRNFVEDIFSNLLTDTTDKDEKSIIQVINSVISRYRGISVDKILLSMSYERSRAKHWLNLMCKKIISNEYSSKLAENNALKKAGIEMKTILLQPSGIPKEHMSFEQIKYDEIVNEEWETSFVREKFENKKHLWIVFQALKPYQKQSELQSSDIILSDVLVWNMPVSDLSNDYRNLWEDTVEKIQYGNFQSFIKPNVNRVGHIRPKATNSKDKVEFRGNLVPKKCFWLNNLYVASEIVRLKNNS